MPEANDTLYSNAVGNELCKLLFCVAGILTLHANPRALLV